MFTPIDRLVKGVFDFSKVCSSRIGEEIFDFLSSRSLIAFEAHNVVAVLINNRLRDVPLASHGVDRNGGSSDIQEFKKLRNGRNLVGFLFSRDLTERQLVVRDPGAHYMQCLLACRAIERVAYGLAVNCNEFAVSSSRQSLHPRNEACIESHWVNCAQHPSKRVRARNSLGQTQERPEPILLSNSEFLHILPSFAHANHRQQGNDKNIHEQVIPGALHARVLHPFKEFENPKMAFFLVTHRRDEISPCSQWKALSCGRHPNRSHKV